MNLTQAINNAFLAVHDFKTTNPETRHFPCGFAWVSFKCRKNSKVGKELQALGARWSDYNKYYRISVPTRTQDMEYNIRCCEAFVRAMKANGFDGFNVESRID